MSSENPLAYVGITGVPQDTAIASDINRLLGKNTMPSHGWMTGHLISQRAFTQDSIANPQYHSLASLHPAIEQTYPHAFTTVHYIPKEYDTLPTQVIDLFTRTGVYADGLCDGLQINNYLPRSDELSRIKDNFPELQLIVQLGPQQLETNPTQLAESLSRYTGLADYVLLDPSLGKGRQLQVSRVIPFATAIQDSLPDATVIFAGGITPNNIVSTVTSLRSNMPPTTPFGIDAQHGFLTRRDRGYPVFDIEKVRGYIKNAQNAFRTDHSTSS